MPQAALAGILVAHGAITLSIGLVSTTNPSAPAMTLPAWFGWWPGPFGRSWLIDMLQLGSGAAVAGGILWLAAGLALIAGGLGWWGVPVLAELWQAAVAGGALVGLVALALYFHPIYLLAIVINVAVVAVATGAVQLAR